MECNAPQPPEPRALRLQPWVLRLLIITLAIGPMIYGFTVRTASASDLKPLSKALVLLKAYYYDDLNTAEDTENLVENAINGMLGTLDPHTNYHNRDAFQRMSEEQKGEFAGIGITFSIRNQYITVISAIEDTPSYRLGIRAGDQIVKIEGEDAKGISSYDVVNKLRGKPGTSVNVHVRRPGKEELMEFDITRERIPLYSVPYSFMLDEEAGYIFVSNFADKTADELQEKIKELQGEGMQKLVLDLRGNPGGLLKAAKEVSELFLPRGSLIVETKGRIPDSRMDLYSEARRPIVDMPLIVLVDGGSASASEIVSGAVQDHDRGLVVGTRTYGKGLVQRLYELREDAALQLTTAAYYTPSGRSIQRSFTNSDFQLHPEDLVRKSKMAPSSEDGEQEKYYTDKNRVVYGGGGITPDETVESNLYANLVLQMRSKSFFFNFALQHVEGRRDSIGKTVDVTDAIVEEFKAFLTEKEFEYEDEEFSENLDAIKAWIAREIGSAAHDANTGQMNFMRYDAQVRAALDKMSEAKALLAME